MTGITECFPLPDVLVICSIGKCMAWHVPGKTDRESLLLYHYAGFRITIA